MNTRQALIDGVIVIASININMRRVLSHVIAMHSQVINIGRNCILDVQVILVGVPISIYSFNAV